MGESHNQGVDEMGCEPRQSDPKVIFFFFFGHDMWYAGS